MSGREKINSNVSSVVLSNEDIKELLKGIMNEDEEIFSHLIRTATLVSGVCEELNFDEVQTCALVKEALLLDVGKKDIPKEILHKVGGLEKDERKAMQKHPEMSAKIAREVGLDSEQCKRILYHHYRTDGSGYPNLFGKIKDKRLLEDIEILSMCDMFSAITQPRSYRKAQTPEYAFDEIRKEPFDVMLVTTLKKVGSSIEFKNTLDDYCKICLLAE